MLDQNTQPTSILYRKMKLIQRRAMGLKILKITELGLEYCILD